MNKKFISKDSIWITLVFFSMSILWILLSEKLIFHVLTDAKSLSVFQNYKAWLYVAIVSIYIFYIVNWQIGKKNKLIYLLNTKNEWQKLLISNLPNVEVILFDKNPEAILMQGEKIIPPNTNSHEKSLDKLLNFNITNQDHSYKKHKSEVLSGKSINYKVENENYQLEIKGRPIKDDKGNIIAGILVYIDVTEHKTVLTQLNEEKENYSALFNEYHTVNLELKRSYEELIHKNDSLLNSKERYQNFFIQSSDGSYRIDFKHPLDKNDSISKQRQRIIENGYLAECNPVFAQIYGMEGLETLLAQKITDTLNTSTIKAYFKLIESFIQNNYILKNIESSEPTNDGKERFFLNTMIGVFEEDKLVRIWGTKTNITTLKQYEKDLLKSKTMAEESARLKSAFLANMSHEIRTPLNGIIGFAELLCQNNLDENQKTKYIHIIKTSNSQLLRIIDDILDISRIEIGQLSISKKDFSLNELMQQLEIYISKSIEKSGKPIIASCHSNFEKDDYTIHSDLQRLHQVITNLINNAIKFTAEGEIDLGFTFISDSEMEFYIQDTGIGIPSNMHESIFKQFKQVEDYYTRAYGGTGLGLSISKGIVELLGGKITVESALNRGSTFRFTIPFN